MKDNDDFTGLNQEDCERPLALRKRAKQQCNLRINRRQVPVASSNETSFFSSATNDSFPKELKKNHVNVFRTNYSKIKNQLTGNVPSIKVIFLGGLNQIGKNITAFECGEDIIIVDCGMAFPDGEMLGVDLVIPDFTWLEQNKERIRGLIVTHGHEDHIGSVPYLLKKIDIPIYATLLSIGLIGAKLKEHKLRESARLKVFNVGDKFDLGCFSVEFIHVNHSIPDAVALAIRTPAGTIIHMGDFKIDCSPAYGDMIDLPRFSELGKEGVLLLMSDSTNADRDGYTMSEMNLNKSFERFFAQAVDKRIVVATFASNIGRVRQIIDCAVRNNRKVSVSGRSMVSYVNIARELGYIDAPKKVMVDIDSIGKYPPGEMVLLTTGSQGEPMSALYRMAFSEHKKIEITSKDFIIISANPIPGNERMVNSVVNELMKFGCEVIHESMYEIHVSGHACREELKIILGLVKPKFFIPMHGERKHLAKHAELAITMGMEKSDVYIGETGDMIEISEMGLKKIGTVSSEIIMVDGIGVGDVGSIVMRDRKHLGEDGLITAVVSISMREKKIYAGPEIVSRGFVYVRESEDLMSEAKKIILKGIFWCFEQKNCDWNMIKTKIRDDLYKFFRDRTRRNPVILPVIMDIKK
jgi:ribonuclease J